MFAPLDMTPATANYIQSNKLDTKQMDLMFVPLNMTSASLDMISRVRGLRLGAFKCRNATSNSKFNLALQKSNVVLQQI